jgi:hypothetical protein
MRFKMLWPKINLLLRQPHSQKFLLSKKFKNLNLKRLFNKRPRKMKMKMKMNLRD